MKKLLFVVLVFTLINIGGCATSQYKFEYQREQADVIWPPPPEMPRIKYLGVIKGDNNFHKIEGSEGFVRKGLSWLGELVFGEEAPRLLYRPQSGAIDNKNQRLYVTDVGGKSVFVFDLKNGSLDVWEGADANSDFLTPIAVCLLDENQIFVTDADLGYVIKFDQDGQSLMRIGENRLSRPTGLACDKENNKIYVSDSQAHKIHVFSAEGQHLFVFGKKGDKEGELNAPTHLTFVKNKLFVSDTLNARVQVFNADGRWLSSFGKRGMYVGNLPRPKGIALDSDGHIYVIESYYDHLLIFDKTGKGLLPIGGSGNRPGQFNLPAGIWIGESDVIYVADMFNKRIVAFQYLKSKETVNAIEQPNNIN